MRHTKKPYLYGRCPQCKFVGLHKFQGYSFIVDYGKSSRFKCKKCKKDFGFLVSDKVES